MKKPKSNKNLTKLPKRKIKINLGEVKKPPKKTKKQTQKRLKITESFEDAIHAAFTPKLSPIKK